MGDTIDFAPAIEAVAKLKGAQKVRVRVIEAHDRRFIADEETGEHVEVLPRLEDIGPRLEAPVLLALGDLVAWCEAAPAMGEIRVSRAGTTVAMTPRAVEPYMHRDRADRPFFARYLPPVGTMTADQFREWIDMIRDGMTEADVTSMDLALSSLTATSSEATEVVQSGAVIRTSFKRGDEVGARPMPRLITAAVPFGDPGFVTPVRFVLTCEIKDKRLTFRARHDESDQAHDRWTAWAREVLSGLGWLVLVTP